MFLYSYLLDGIRVRVDADRVIGSQRRQLLPIVIMLVAGGGLLTFFRWKKWL